MHRTGSSNVLCLRLAWDFHTWTGLCWLHDDSGRTSPGLDLSGATAIRFLARRESEGGSQIKVTYINDSHLQRVTLGSESQAYEPPITNPGQPADVWSLFSVVLEPGPLQIVCLDNIRLIFDHPAPSLPAIEVAGTIFDPHGARLLVNGHGFPVVGAGYGVRNSESEVEDLTTLLPVLRANRVRTWTNECTFRRLDAGHGGMALRHLSGEGAGAGGVERRAVHPRPSMRRSDEIPGSVSDTTTRSRRS